MEKEKVVIMKEKLGPKFSLALRIVIFIFILVGTIYVMVTFRPKKESGMVSEEPPKETETSEELPTDHRIDSNSPVIVGKAVLGWKLDEYKASSVNKEERIQGYTIDQVTMIAGNLKEFVILATFTVQSDMAKETGNCTWGNINDQGVVACQKMLRIKQNENANQYTVVEMADKISTDGLDRVTYAAQMQEDTHIVEGQKTYDYQWRQQELYVTYDAGKSWKAVGISISEYKRLSEPKYGNVLQIGSYVITPEKTVFTFGGNNDTIYVRISEDQGNTWNTYAVANVGVARAFYVGFYSSLQGYMVVGTNREGSQEESVVLQTKDGGKTWMRTGANPSCHRNVAGGTFISEKIGFITYRSLDYDPLIYRTVDGGNTWEKQPLNFPKELQYKEIYTMALSPTFTGKEGTLIVTPGDDDKEMKGKVARFVSHDEGATWQFDAEVTNVIKY